MADSAKTTAQAAVDCPVVFVSYAREDRAFVAQLSAALQGSNVQVCGDWQLVRGEDYQQQLNDLQLGCDAAIFVISPDSVRSAPCRDELDRATQHGQRILPVLRHDAETLEPGLPPALSSPQWTFLRAEDDFAIGIQALVEAIHTDFDLMPGHRRLLQAAETWQRNGRSSSYLLRKDGLKQAEEWLLKTGARPGQLPKPTALQLEYITASQYSRTKGSRTALAVVAAIAVSMLVLAIIALLQRNLAEQQRNEAQRQKDEAQQQRNEAQRQTRIAQDQTQKANEQQHIAEGQTKVAQQQRAVARQQQAEAEREATIANSERLATAAMLRRDRFFDLGALLAVEAARTADTFEARNSLLTFFESTRGVAGYFNHFVPVYGSAFSPDGRLLAVACEDGRIQVWDVATHLRVGPPIRAHSGVVFDVTFSPDGKLLASTGQDKVIRLWDAATHEPKGELRGHEEAVARIAFSPDSKLLASAGMDSYIRFWDVAGRRPSGQPLHGHGYARLTVVQFSPNGKLLVSAAAGIDHTIRLWDVERRTQVGVPMGGRAPGVSRDQLRVVAFSPDGTRLASGDFDGTIQLWDVATQKKAGEAIQAHDGAVTALSFSPNGKAMASADGTHGIIRVSNPEFASSIGETQPINVTGITGITFSPDGKLMAISGRDGAVQLWEAARFINARPLVHSQSVRGIAFLGDRRSLAFAGDGRIQVWDSEHRKPLDVPPFNPKEETIGIAASPDGRLLASASIDKTVHLWDVEQRRQAHEPLQAGAEIWSLGFSRDGSMLAAGLENGSIRLWDTKAGNDGGSLRGHHGHVFSVAFSPAGDILASAGEDGSIRVWDLSHSGKDKTVLPGFNWGKETGFAERAVAFNRDGSTLAAVGQGGLVQLWRTSDYRSMGEPLKAYVGMLYSVAFSPDGTLMATGGERGLIQLWDLALRERLGEPIVDHPISLSDDVRTMAFRPDGRLLVSAGDYGIQATDLEAEVWKRRICGTISRNLSKLEFQQYLGVNIEYHRTCANLPDGEQ